MVVPLLKSGSPPAGAEVEGERRPRLGPPPAVITRAERCVLPGEDWAYFQLYAGYAQHQHLITAALYPLVGRLYQQGLIDRWFYIRYGHPEPHLRLRFHAKTEPARAELAHLLLSWCREVVRGGAGSRFSIATYEREVERYGGPLAIELAEEVFSIDSAMACALLAAQRAGAVTLDALTLSVWSLDRFFAAWGLSSQERLRWVRDLTGRDGARTLFRERRRELCELLSPWVATHDETLARQRETLAVLLAPHEEALARAALPLRALAGDGRLWVSEEDLLRSLAHMHLNRLNRPQHPEEALVYLLWRQVLESLRLRPGASP